MVSCRGSSSFFPSKTLRYSARLAERREREEEGERGVVVLRKHVVPLRSSAPTTRLGGRAMKEKGKEGKGGVNSFSYIPNNSRI